MKKIAILVVDMLNDFVTGILKCDRGLAIVPHLSSLLDNARKYNIAIIFCNDCHDANDHELSLWGPHAMRGTDGAKIIPELKYDNNKDIVIDKHVYSGFFKTNLDDILKKLGVDTVVITGLHAHMCCRHTAADAYQNGYDVVVATDCTDSFTLENYELGIKYLKEVYGAKLLTSKELIQMKFNLN